MGPEGPTIFPHQAQGLWELNRDVATIKAGTGTAHAVTLTREVPTVGVVYISACCIRLFEQLNTSCIERFGGRRIARRTGISRTENDRISWISVQSAVYGHIHSRIAAFSISIEETDVGYDIAMELGFVQSGVAHTVKIDLQLALEHATIEFSCPAPEADLPIITGFENLATDANTITCRRRLLP